MKRPIFLYVPRMHYHTPAQLAAKSRWLKWMWFVLPVTLALGRGDFWTDPYDPAHPSFQWAPAIVILAWYVVGLGGFYLIRFLFFRAVPGGRLSAPAHKRHPIPPLRLPS